jgi:hypothetical protein
VSVNEKLAVVWLVGLAGFAVIVGVGGTTCHVYELAALRLVAASLASTENVCEPSARPAYERGLAQGAYAAPSSLHRKLTPASLSENEKLADVTEVLLGGLAVIDGAGGGVRSTTHEYDAGLLRCPFLSDASTLKLYGPSASGALAEPYVLGLVQAENAAPLRLHR